MKLAIPTSQYIANLAALRALPSAGLSNMQLAFVADQNTAYMYFSNAKTGDEKPDDMAVENRGRWQIDTTARLIESVANDYDFGANSATDLTTDIPTLITTNKWRLGDYTPTHDDVRQLLPHFPDWTTFIRKIDGIDPDLVTTTPYINKIDFGTMPPSASHTIVVHGAHFQPTTRVNIPSWGGTIDDVRILSDTLLEIDVTSDASVSDFDLQLYNGIKSSTEYNASGTNAVKTRNVPDGAERYLRIASASGTNYDGTAFGASELSNGRRVERAFDNNTGSRHYSASGSGLNHYAGIIMSADTWITSVAVFFLYSQTTQLTLEGSTDTTDGTDGIWDTIQVFDDPVMGQTYDVAANFAVYRAFRIKWTTTTSSIVGAREILFTGKQ